MSLICLSASTLGNLHSFVFPDRLSCLVWLFDSLQLPARTASQLTAGRKKGSGSVVSCIRVLPVQGLQRLQQEAMQLAVLIAQAVSPRTPPPQHLATLLSNSRISHLFCHNPLPSQSLQKSAQHDGESNRKTGGNTGCVDSFWEEAAALCPGSLLEAKVKLSAECCCTESPSTSGRDDDSTSPVQQLRNVIAHNASGSRRSVPELVKQGGLLQLVAERLLREGRRDEALCEATEALRIRFGLFGHTFGTAKGSETEGQSDGEESQPQSKSAILTPTAMAGRAGWISLYSQKAVSGRVSVLHNPWRIVGDYLESLLLVGTLWESAGMVDDAEQNFREGRRIAEAVGAAHAEAEFHSAMGEVKRKKGNWEAAKEAFERARRLLLEEPVDCEGCRVLALARLERREGDLIRRQPESVPGERRSALGAGEHYERAAKLLRSIVGSGFDRAQRDWTGSLVEVGLGSDSWEGEDGSIGSVKRNLMGAMAAAERTKGHVAAVKRRPGRKAKVEPKLEPLTEAPVIPKKGRQSRKKAAIEVITVLSSDDEEKSCISEAETPAPKAVAKRKGPVRGRVHKLAQESSTSELENEASSTSVVRPVVKKQLRGKQLRSTAGGSDAASESSPPSKTSAAGWRAAHVDLDKMQEKLRRVVPYEKESVLPALRGSRLRGPVSDAAEMEALRTGLGRISLSEAEAAPQTECSEGGFKPWLPGAREELGRVLLQQGAATSDETS
jgi:tetratricopeptide (TPR) repeat protein